MSIRIGLIGHEYSTMECLQKGLEKSGNVVTIYTSGEACLRTLLEARFYNQPLPHDVMLLYSPIDELLDADQDGDYLLECLREFVREDELPFVRMIGINLTAYSVFEVEWLDLRRLEEEENLTEAVQLSGESIDRMVRADDSQKELEGIEEAVALAGWSNDDLPIELGDGSDWAKRVSDDLLEELEDGELVSDNLPVEMR